MKLVEISKLISCSICGCPEVSFQDQEDKDYFYCAFCAKTKSAPDNSNESLTNEERNR
jgi:hypothetical protein